MEQWCLWDVALEFGESTLIVSGRSYHECSEQRKTVALAYRHIASVEVSHEDYETPHVLVTPCAGRSYGLLLGRLAAAVDLADQRRADNIRVCRDTAARLRAAMERCAST